MSRCTYPDSALLLLGQLNHYGRQLLLVEHSAAHCQTLAGGNQSCVMVQLYVQGLSDPAMQLAASCLANAPPGRWSNVSCWLNTAPLYKCQLQPGDGMLSVSSVCHMLLHRFGARHLDVRFFEIDLPQASRWVCTVMPLQR